MVRCSCVDLAGHTLVGAPVEQISPKEGLFAKAWSGCTQQHIPSCKGAFHDIASTTVYRGHAGPELFAGNTSLLHPRSLGICPLLQQVTRVVGSGTDSCLSDLSDQGKEAGGR